MAMGRYPKVDVPDLDTWSKAAAKSAPDGHVEGLTWTTPEGISVKPLYTRVDVEGLPWEKTAFSLPPITPL